MQQLDVEGRPATVDERQVLARWSSWGAIPQVFDDAHPGWSTEYAELRSLLDDAAYGAARRTTINAHYTAPEITREMWSALEQLGFDGGVVLEPGCGSGTFIGTALGAVLLTEIFTAITFLGLSQTYQYLFQGLLIMIAAVIYTVLRGSSKA